MQWLDTNCESSASCPCDQYQQKDEIIYQCRKQEGGAYIKREGHIPGLEIEFVVTIIPANVESLEMRIGNFITETSMFLSSFKLQTY